MRKIGSDNRGLSNLVAYVMLIAITISLSVMVYGWLKFYVEGDEVVACSENVNVIISGYECSSGATGNLTVTLKNKGLFNIDGFILRVHNRTDAEFGFYVFTDNGVALGPGQSNTTVYNFATHGVFDVTLVDVQPFVLEDGKISCETYASQRVVCS